MDKTWDPCVGKGQWWIKILLKKNREGEKPDIRGIPWQLFAEGRAGLEKTGPEVPAKLSEARPFQIAQRNSQGSLVTLSELL